MQRKKSKCVERLKDALKKREIDFKTDKTLSSIFYRNVEPRCSTIEKLIRNYSINPQYLFDLDYCDELSLNYFPQSLEINILRDLILKGFTEVDIEALMDILNGHLIGELDEKNPKSVLIGNLSDAITFGKKPYSETLKKIENLSNTESYVLLKFIKRLWENEERKNEVLKLFSKKK